MRHPLSVIALLALALTLGGCAHYQVVSQGSSGSGAKGGEDVVLRAGEDAGAKIDCGARGVHDIDIRSGLGDVALMFLSLGIAPPSGHLTWHCGQPCQPSGDSPGEKPEVQRRTATSLLWGAYLAKPQIDCKRAYLSRVNVTSSFGQRLLSVLTLGIASPRTVEWVCAPRCEPGASPIKTGTGAAESTEAGR